MNRIYYLIIFIMILKSGSILGLIYPKHLSFLLILLLLITIRSVNLKYVLNTFILIFILLLQMVITENHSILYINLIFHIVVLTIATMVFYKISIIEYIKPVLYFIILHSLLNYFLLFIPINKIYLMEGFSTIAYLFYYGDSSISIIYRNQGLFWEPGILQLFINLYIFILLFVEERLQRFKFLVSSIALILTYSSTGYIIYFLLILKKYMVFKIKYIPLVIIPILMLCTLVPNLINKFVGEYSLSGAIRTLDFYVSLQIFVDNIFVGAGLKANYPEYYTQYWYRYSDYIINLFNMPFDYYFKLAEDGITSTNSLVIFLASFGIFGFIFFIIILYKVTFIFTTRYNFLFMLIFLLTFFSEPIILLNFFLFLYLLAYNQIMNKFMYKKTRSS